MKGSYAQTKRIIIVLLAVASLFISTTLRVPAKPPTVPKTGTSRADVRVAERTDEGARMRVSQAYGTLPMSFEPNRGQTDGRVKFLSRGSGYTLLLTQTEATLALYKNEAESDPTLRSNHSSLSSVVRMKLKGTNPKPKIEGLEQLQGKSNYLIGNDRAKWQTNIPTFAKVRYTGVYPGIDVVYYGTNQRELEYDFRLAPGAHPDSIKIMFEGADKITFDAEGNLVLKVKGEEIIQRAPVIYQEFEGARQMIMGRFVLNGAGEVSMEVGAYDASRPLVIDPAIKYSSFYGGNGTDIGNGVAADSNGNVYIAGETHSTDLIVRNAFQAQLSPGTLSTDAFVTKLNTNASGNASLVYSTYLGGSNSFGDFDRANAIAVTSDGRACITGRIDNNCGRSTFPVFHELQGNGSGVCLAGSDRHLDAFITVLTATGNSLAYSTFFGGNDTIGISFPTGGSDEGLGIAVDASNKIYVTGFTSSNNLNTKNAFHSSRRSSDDDTDAFIAKFDPTQSGNASLLYSSFFGGHDSNIGRAIAVDTAGNAYIVGETTSADMDVKSPSSLPPLQSTKSAGTDGFVAEFDLTQSGSSSLVYSTFFGGDNTDQVFAVAVDSSQRAYITGSTLSSAASFPLKNAFNTTQANGEAFVAKLNSGGTALFYSSFLGGNSADQGNGIAVDAGGSAYVTGKTDSSNFPAVNAFDSILDGGQDAFVTKIEPSDATGTTTPKVLYSSFLGGDGNDEGHAIALDPRGNVYLTGLSVSSTGFPITSGAFQTSKGLAIDAFATKVDSTFPDTIGVFRPSTGQFLLRNSNTAGSPNFTFTFGQSGDKPVVGDWNGDGVTDIGVFRNGTFLLATVQTTLKAPCLFCIPVLTTAATPLPSFSFGPSAGSPVAGDWNGDGIDTIGVFSNGTFQLRNSNTAGSADLTFGFGAAGDKPVAGDWNGDGIDTVGVFRVGSDCTFLLTNNNSTVNITANGFCTVTGDPPVTGDWNGDGIDSLGVFSAALGNKFFLTDNNATLIGQAEIQFSFGQFGDIPLAGDWNGRPDPFTPPNSGVNDPSSGTSSAGQIQTFITTCSDPDGWHDIASIDFKIAKSDPSGNGNGVPIALWVQFNENTGLVRFYNPDSQTWSQGEPGSNVVLSSRFADLHLADTSVLGSGPTGASVQVAWSIVFKNAAVMNNYKQYLRITDDSGLSTGFDKVGSWNVAR